MYETKAKMEDFCANIRANSCIELRIIAMQCVFGEHGMTIMNILGYGQGFFLSYFI